MVRVFESPQNAAVFGVQLPLGDLLLKSLSNPYLLLNDLSLYSPSNSYLFLNDHSLDSLSKPCFLLWTKASPND